MFSWLPAWNCRRHVAILRALTHKVIHQNDRQHRLSDRYGADADARIVAPFGDHLHFFAKAVNRMTGNGNTGGRLQRDVGNDLLAAADAAKNAAGVVALEPGFGDLIAVSLPRSFTTSKPSPISTPFTALMLISAWAISASRRSKTGSPRPGGTPSATTVTFAPMESPSFSGRASVHRGVDFIRVRAEEGVLLNLIPIFDGQRNIAHLRQAAANDDAELRGKVFLAIAPAATRIAVSRAEERPPPR